MKLGAIVYIIGALTSAACAVLLMRGYVRGRKKLLLWSGLCFTILSISNLLIFVDLVLFRMLTSIVTGSVALALLCCSFCMD